MTLTVQMLIGAVVAFLVSTALSALLTWAGPIDRPEDRRLHVLPTPTSGGLAIIGGVLVAALVFGFSLGGPAEASPAILALAAVLGLLGAVDDVFDIGARTKLIVQVLAALGFAAIGAHVEALPIWPGSTLQLGPIVGVLGSALWIVVVVNAVNFMDGANGLVAGALAIAFAGLAAVLGLRGVPDLALLALVGAAGNLGFLPWNFPKGRLFQGDVGAFFSAAFFAGLCLAGADRSGDGPAPLMIGPLLILPLLVDVFMTLIGRARRRVRLFEAHREHLYQRRILAAGNRSTRVVIWLWVNMAIFAVLAVLLVVMQAADQLPLLLIPLAIELLAWLGQDRLLKGPPSGR
jgi:UDP-N-acetylmuramyl pentapeptide phosphotransferase/UDP-N-acetylglucosamine-1-phosphate transferase